MGTEPTAGDYPGPGCSPTAPDTRYGAAGNAEPLDTQAVVEQMEALEDEMEDAPELWEWQALRDEWCDMQDRFGVAADPDRYRRGEQWADWYERKGRAPRARRARCRARCASFCAVYGVVIIVSAVGFALWSGHGKVTPAPIANAPAATLLHQAPRSLGGVVTDPPELCALYGRVPQPLHVALLQAALTSLALTLAAALPGWLGGSGDPARPGAVALVLAAWGVAAGVYSAFDALFMASAPPHLELSPPARYALHVWLAAQHPNYQGLITVVAHLAICRRVSMPRGVRRATIAAARAAARGWRARGASAALAAAGGAAAAVALPLLVTHILPQLVLLPVGAIFNIVRPDPGFYWMLLQGCASVLLTGAIVIGPAGCLVVCLATYVSPPAHGASAVDQGRRTVSITGAVLAAAALTALAQDLAAASIMVYDGAEPAAAQLAPYGARQTCAWLDCVDTQESAGGHAQWLCASAALTPPVAAAGALTPVECRGGDGSVSHPADWRGLGAVLATAALVTGGALALCQPMRRALARAAAAPFRRGRERFT